MEDMLMSTPCWLCNQNADMDGNDSVGNFQTEGDPPALIAFSNQPWLNEGDGHLILY